ncbi:MAG: VCBS repeat-containing protein, partial [Acidobacteria bacterium]|nr:VCBS repeat-containing protein [Acidobacteriota bacterium]
MPRQKKSKLHPVLPVLLAAICLLSGALLHPAQAQCSRPGFKLNYGYFSTVAHKAITADFNADGKTDIATSAYSDQKAAVYFGDGTGGFSAPTVYSTTLGPITKVLAGDVNNDAKLDLILVVDHFSANDFVSVLINNGSGAFGAPVDSSFPFNPFTMQMLDLNGDGKGDLVYLLSSSPTSLAVRFGDGSGNFSQATTYAVLAANSFVTGDFTGDGKPDVAVYTNNLATAKLVLYLNDGSGGLTPGTETTLGLDAIISLARDLNGDGKSDIAGVKTGSGNYAVMVLLNNGSGGFNRTDYPISLPLTALRAGEFNGDGKVDLIAGRFDMLTSLTLYGNGAGGFAEGEKFAVALGWPDQDGVADFNGDGKSDLGVAQSAGVRAFLRTCNDVSNTKRVDYDGDGLTDFAVWRPSTGEWIIRQSSNAILRTQAWGLASLGDVPVPGDYDGDNKSDLAVFRA